MADISFSAIHGFFKKVIEEVETKGNEEVKAVASDVQVALSAAKVEAMKEVAALAPDIQAAVAKGVSEMEQAVLAAIAAHIL